MTHDTHLNLSIPIGYTQNPMKISFLDADIEALCKQSKLAGRKLGMKSAKKKQRRLSELFAASVVADLVAGHPHPLERGNLRWICMEVVV